MAKKAKTSEPKVLVLFTSKVLVLSTAHMNCHEEGSGNIAEWARLIGPIGWLCEAAQADDPTTPRSLVAPLRRASGLGCAYALFSRDGAVLEGLPVYEWTPGVAAIRENRKRQRAADEAASRRRQ